AIDEWKGQPFYPLPQQSQTSAVVGQGQPNEHDRPGISRGRHDLCWEYHLWRVYKYLGNGYQLLDVRYQFEIETFGQIKPSIHIPLHQLRSRYNELDPDGKYVIYCKSGNRSQVAAMFLEQRGIKSVSLIGGISSWPFPL
ncbi:MAG: rhodanese-like domain-containing protein, partial [Thiohalomonadaceae bacterium]